MTDMSDAERMAALEAEVAALRARAADAALLSEAAARLTQVGAAARLSNPAEHSELLRLIVQAAMHVLSARAGSLYLVDEAAEQLVWEVALGERAAPLVGQRIPLGQGVAGWVAATGQAIAVADVQTDPRWMQDVGRAVGYMPKTMLAVPLLVGDTVTGVLQLLDRDGGNPFTAADMETLGHFANQAAVAIQQSRSIRSLRALVRTALADLDGDDPLVDRLADFSGGLEQTADYADLMRLAAQIGDIARRGDAGRRLALDVMSAIAAFLAGQRRYGGM